MSELKFRIWIKDEKRYYDESREERYLIVPNGNIIYTSEAYEENGVWFTDTTSATDDVIVEQYTGLKDKNGKEIYEGDIVECDYCNENHLISWCSNAACFESWRSDKAPCLTFGESHEELHYKVVGNINQNPGSCGEEAGR